MSQNTSIPGLPPNFHSTLPTASQQVIYRPGWVPEINTSTKTINGK